MKKSILRILIIIFAIALTVSIAACSTNGNGIDDVKRSQTNAAIQDDINTVDQDSNLEDEVSSSIASDDGIIDSFANDYEKNDGVFEESIPIHNPIHMTEEEEAIYKQALAQHEAVIINDYLMTAFGEEYGKDGGWPKRYPDNFAGTYINENGQLVIQIKNSKDNAALDTKNLNKEYNSFIDIKRIKEHDIDFKADNISDVVIYDQVDYSYNELKEMMSFVENIVAEEFPVIGGYIDTFNNSIVIQIDQYVYDKIIDISAEIDAYMYFRCLIDKDIPFTIEVAPIIEPFAHRLGGAFA